MTCMKWDSKAGGGCYFGKYKGGVFAGEALEFGSKNGCDHAVLIVGYSPSYWIVRNSHGTKFGEDGYFKIKKGINSCGIEDYVVVALQLRNYEELFEADLAEMRLRNRVQLAKRSCADTMSGAICAKYKARGLCKSSTIAKRCPASCDACPEEDEVEEEKTECADSMSGSLCAKYKARGLCASSTIAKRCPVTCDACADAEEEEKVVCQDQKSNCDAYAKNLGCERVKELCPVTCDTCADDEEALEPKSNEIEGQCYPLTIENGTVKQLHLYRIFHQIFLNLIL
eukprot:sb/3467791/